MILRATMQGYYCPSVVYESTSTISFATSLRKTGVLNIGCKVLAFFTHSTCFRPFDYTANLLLSVLLVVLVVVRLTTDALCTLSMGSFSVQICRWKIRQVGRRPLNVWRSQLQRLLELLQCVREALQCRQLQRSGSPHLKVTALRWQVVRSSSQVGACFHGAGPVWRHCQTQNFRTHMRCVQANSYGYLVVPFVVQIYFLGIVNGANFCERFLECSLFVSCLLNIR